MKKCSLILLLPLLLLAAACHDEEKYEPYPTSGEKSEKTEQTETTTIDKSTAYADQFAIDALEVYYLWIDEDGMETKIENKLNPKTCSDPISAVEDIRHSEDRWTCMVESFSDMVSSTDNSNTTMGQSLQVGRFSNTDNEYFMVVSYVFPGSPADKAGVKRGDIYISYNGASITDSNLEEAYYGTSEATYGFGQLEEQDGSYVITTGGKNVTLTPVDMYSDPVLCTKTFDVNGKKIGYLAYTDFDSKSISTLIEKSKYFKSQGISELVLDLRYNGGGYVETEKALASMLAPEVNVDAGDVYYTEVYNALLSKNWDGTVKFTTDFSDPLGSGTTYSTAGANMGIDKIYALVSSSTASAAESLIVCLMPYIDIEVIGEQTHGKFCTGYMFKPSYLYKNVPTDMDDWGMYVMVGAYADKDGNNACRPDGLTPDTEVPDNPMDGYQLGDENETMLRAALTAAGKQYVDTRSSARPTHYPATWQMTSKMHGLRIMTKPQMPVSSLRDSQ